MSVETALDLIAIIVSLVSIVIAIWSARLAKRSAKASERSATAAEDTVSLTQEQLIDNWISLVEDTIKQQLPQQPGYLNHAIGLRVARLIDGLPESLQPHCQEIVKNGFYRTVPAGNFESFWRHLCNIQDWEIDRLGSG